MEQEIYRLLYELEDRHWWFRGRWAVIEALLRAAPLPDSPRVLDAGCGTGRNLLRYSRLGPAEGMDPSADAVEFCRRRGLEVEQGTLERLPFEDGRFELVAATDVIEHVDDDGRALEELRRVSAPDASLLLTVPAYRWLWSDEDVRLEHKRRYTRPSLRSVVERAGWTVTRATYFNLLLLPPIALARKLRRSSGERQAELEATPGWLNGPLSVPMRAEAKLIGAGIDLPAGVSLALLARRA